MVRRPDDAFGSRTTDISILHPSAEQQPYPTGETKTGPFAKRKTRSASQSELAVLEAEALQAFAEGKGFVARSVVGHHRLDLHAQACAVGYLGLEEGDVAPAACSS